jgi:hypothetical protein
VNGCFEGNQQGVGKQGGCLVGFRSCGSLEVSGGWRGVIFVNGASSGEVGAVREKIKKLCYSTMHYVALQHQKRLILQTNAA